MLPSFAQVIEDSNSTKDTGASKSMLDFQIQMADKLWQHKLAHIVLKYWYMTPTLPAKSSFIDLRKQHNKQTLH